MSRSPDPVRNVKRNPSPDRLANSGNFSIEKKLIPVAVEDSLDFLGNVVILAADVPAVDRPLTRLPKARIGLGQLETDIAAAEHDHMRWQVAKLIVLNSGERVGCSRRTTPGLPMRPIRRSPGIRRQERACHRH